jgi:hypothetical protein
MDSEDRHQRLVSWMIDNSIDLSRSLRLQESPLGGIGVFANKKIDKNSVLLSVPKDCVLSPATCGISNLLEEHEIDGMIGLTVAYMFEKSQGTSSPWYSFLESFDYEPSPMSLPRFWTEQEQEWLKGTELEAIGGLEEEEVSSVYEEIVGPFIEENKEFFKEEFRSYEAYANSLMAVCSRAFEVDIYRGLSLVPGACLFNHSMDEDVHFESHNEVCISCGAVDFCDHDVERIMEEAQGVYEEEDRPEPIETPREFVPELLDEEDEFEDVDGEEEEVDEEENSDDEGDFDDSDGEEEGPDSCDIRAIKTIAPGKEIFNTYGEYPNGILLSKYGFAEWDNLHETISLADQITAYAKSNSDLSKRLKWWAKNFFLCIFPLEQIEEEGLDSDMPWQDTAEVLSSGQPSEGLKLLLNLLTLSPKKLLLFQARASKGNRDGLTQMSSPKEATQLYRKLVRKRLDRYKDSLTSAQYKALLDEIPADECRKIMAVITRGTEKLVLERALEYKL